MHELLVGYLLNEIDDDQRRLVEEQLLREPELRRQLEQLGRCLGQPCDEEAEATGPPKGLAQRTSETVKQAADSGEFDSLDGFPEGGFPETFAFSSIGFSCPTEANGESSGACSRSWTVADMTVAAGVVLAVGMLLLPALRDSRVASRRVACQNNMKEVGFTLANYSETHNRYMPVIKRGENAGMFTVRLVSGRFIDRQRLARLVVCPSSHLADQIHAKQFVVRIPTLDELQQATRQQKVVLCRTMGGSLAYRLPYRQGNQLRMVRNTYQSNIPVLSDAPRGDRTNYISRNHGGDGENVLYQDLSVRYVVGSLASPISGDHLFLNDEGYPRPGQLPTDTVLARSDAVLRD